MMRKPALTLLATALFLTVAGCKTGYNKKMEWKEPDTGENARTCDETPAAEHADTVRVYQKLRTLSCTNADPDGVLMGQSVGSGNQMLTFADYSFARLFGQVASEAQGTPAVLSIDLEHDRIYSADELDSVTATLVSHANAGGLVSISWSPMNPWISGNFPGAGSTDELRWTDTVDLAALWDTSSDMNAVWAMRLGPIVQILQTLETNNIPVLWRPFPEMNGDEVWWGFDAIYDPEDHTNAAAFQDFWRSLHEYLTDQQQLTNLLWVYSPEQGVAWPTDDVIPSAAPAAWAYPGDEYVDIVAPVVRRDDLTVADYSALLGLGKPMGLASYSPLFAHEEDATVFVDEPFDATQYAVKLKTYPAIAYWVSSPSFVQNGVRSPLALIDMENLLELTADEYILGRDDVSGIEPD